MNPLNNKSEGCTPISSNCVLWQGPDIPCIDLCNGDSVSDVVFKLATELCEIMDMLDIDGYDLSCLKIQSCAPTDFKALVQLLIERICALENIPASTSTGTTGCPNCMVNIATCFQYVDPATSDTVTQLLLDQYVKKIGLKVCELVTQINTANTGLANLNDRVTTLENEPDPTFNLPNITPVCVLDPVPTPLDQVVIELEKEFCELIGATGTPTQIYQGISTEDSNIGDKPALGKSGTMDSYTNWENLVRNLADSVSNIWVVITDLRAAVTNIQENCCPTVCSGVEISLSASLPNANTLVIFLTGTLPAGMVSCTPLGTLFTIKDESGHTITTVIDIAANLNNPAGFPVTISGTPLDTADNFDISANPCFEDSASKSVCQSCIEYTLINSLDCPSVTYSQTTTTISYSFPHISGTVTYTIEVWNNAGTTLVQSQSIGVSGATTVSGTFSGLTAGTTYKVRVTVNNGIETEECPFVAVTTSANPCPPPQSVTTTLTIP